MTKCGGVAWSRLHTKGERGSGLASRRSPGGARTAGDDIRSVQGRHHGFADLPGCRRTRGRLRQQRRDATQPRPNACACCWWMTIAVLKSLGDLLEADGHMVPRPAAASRRSTLPRRAQRREPYSAVVTDLGMPMSTGRASPPPVKDRPTTPVILLHRLGPARLMSDDDSRPTSTAS